MNEQLGIQQVDALSYEEFIARYGAAIATLGHEGGVDAQTKEQMNSVLHCLRVENPGHLQVFQERIEIDRDN